jgi:LmbE family N-acetylglucosaminyl deacetylase
LPTVIHVSPHPDDESIAAPCTLLALQRHGWTVINLAVSYGRSEVRERRSAELARALKIAGFVGVEPSVPIGISRLDNLAQASRTLTGELQALVRDTDATLVVGPHARDGHHGHVAVARAIRQAVWRSPTPLTWWMWSIWADLPRPTLISECAEEDIRTSERMLEEYGGENDRSDYLSMHRAVRRVNAVRGVEKALGFGASPSSRLRGIGYAELLTEVTVRRRSWMLGTTRLLDPATPEGEWERLRDFSVLTPIRFARVLRPTLMSMVARSRILAGRSAAEPLPTISAALRPGTSSSPDPRP